MSFDTWSWHVRGFYGDNVKPPKYPGDLAIEVGGVCKEALSMDIEVLKNREDIGSIILIDPNGNQEVIE